MQADKARAAAWWGAGRLALGRAVSEAAWAQTLNHWAEPRAAPSTPPPPPSPRLYPSLATSLHSVSLAASALPSSAASSAAQQNGARKQSLLGGQRHATQHGCSGKQSAQAARAEARASADVEALCQGVCLEAPHLAPWHPRRASGHLLRGRVHGHPRRCHGHGRRGRLHVHPRQLGRLQARPHCAHCVLRAHDRAQRQVSRRQWAWWRRLQWGGRRQAGGGGGGGASKRPRGLSMQLMLQHEVSEQQPTALWTQGRAAADKRRMTAGPSSGVVPALASPAHTTPSARQASSSQAARMARRWWSWAWVGAARPGDGLDRGLKVRRTRGTRNGAGDTPLEDLGTWGLECVARIPGEMWRWCGMGLEESLKFFPRGPVAPSPHPFILVRSLETVLDGRKPCRAGSGAVQHMWPACQVPKP